ncbi:CHAT domain-containing tetratricopeptide repeat protein [Kribbella sp. NPDC051718]|uniref:CHAT domain-containing protein n=1 Tax=Kribbella sp. NPDC051718 TaxID=3155168 RepID=UPI0034499B0B
MSVASGDPRPGRQEVPDGLLPLAVARPAEAFAAADKLLEQALDPRTASIAHQVKGIVLRDSGRATEAIAELRRAVRLAGRSGDSERMADVEATLGLTLGLAGRAAEGLTALDHAVALSNGIHSGRVLTRRGYLLRVLGRYDEALADLRRAIKVLRTGGDRLWEARSRTHRFLVYAALGQATRADHDLVIAEQLLTAEGQDLESAMAVHNRADLAYQRGDLPEALGFLDEAAARYAALQTSWPSLAIDRSAVLLAAGLASEALASAEEALAHETGNGTATADLLFAAAQAAQAAGQPELAGERAAAAAELFRRQGRKSWQARASFVVLQSRYDAGQRGARLSTQAGRVADRLDELHSAEAASAHLLAGRLAAEVGRRDDADRHLATAARFRRRGPAYGHAAGWLADALRAEGRGATAATLIACRRGLQAAGDHQRSLAAPELRAHAAAYGTELAALAQRHAVRRGDARMLLRWSELWRAGALAVPPVHGPDDRELAEELAALRNISSRLNEADPGPATDRLLTDRTRLESAIRSRTRRLAAHPDATLTTSGKAGDLEELLGGLGEHRLVELTEVDGELFAITVVGRRVRMHRVGPVAAAVREIELARFMLRRLARGRPPARALEALETAGRRLQQVLLGPAAADLHRAAPGQAALGGGPVVVVPTARLQSAPWAMLPALGAVAATVAPSAALWLKAGRTKAPSRRRVALVVGPGLDGSAGELELINKGYPDAITLLDDSATAEAALTALDGAWTAHIAAHGIFRTDNPLFSNFTLHDGPLTIYDLGRLRRAPQRLVLSSCESGVAAAVGSDELLGVVSALVPLGTASLLASVVPVNDAATAGLMVDFHEHLRGGASFGTALRAVRASIADDPVMLATALSFVALGC